jgi:hypothetical protein
MVSARVTDSAGNVNQLAFPIQIDMTPPVPDVNPLPEIRTQPNVAVTRRPTATDALTGPTTGTTPDQLLFLVEGTFQVTWTYCDGHGNSSTQEQTILVLSDATPPVPDLATLPTITGTCSAAITTVPTATDEVSGSVNGTTQDPLSYSQPGTYLITWSYSDAGGNQSVQTQRVTVIDDSAPVPDLAALPDIAGSCMVNVSTAPTATDACVGSVTGTTTDPLTYSTQGTYTVHWTYSDGRGNTSTQNQTVIVSDPIAPVISGLPATQTFIITNPMGTTAALAAPTVTDNCDPPTLTSNAPATFLPGATIVVYTATDAGGNTTQASTTVILQYAFGGLISLSDGSSYALKSAVPIAFQLLGNGGAPIGAGAVCKVYYAKMTRGVPGAESLAGKCVYASATGQYTYSLALKSGMFSTGTWQLRIALNDGTSRTVTIVVTKQNPGR